jgi:hypothetical protein
MEERGEHNAARVAKSRRAKAEGRRQKAVEGERRAALVKLEKAVGK